MSTREKIKQLTEKLNEAAKAYYSGTDEIMSNLEYDQLYDELLQLEEESGIVLASSPTQRVGYEVVSQLPKETHDTPMLSLDKTKEPEALKEWLGNHEGLLSWKLDGLTVVLTYHEGRLQKAVTRGNGTVGEVITANAKTFINLPLSIPYKGRLTIRGEAVISYDDFNKINEEIKEVGEKYKNPRNLCSGSVRQLNSSITARRNVRFMAFALVDGDDLFELRSEQFKWLESQGFDCVYHIKTDAKTIIDDIQKFKSEIESNPVPSDGLVLSYDDIAYGKSLGRTAKFPRDSIAFKWEDQQAETILREVIWSPSRTGLINPIAVFDAVELEGTEVSRASVHNVSMVRKLKLGIGDKIKVYKANMIIPQISENMTKSDSVELPCSCPACDGHVLLKQENGVETLYCPNPLCMAKQVKSLTLFVSRDAMNIEGLSEETLKKFVKAGFIKEPSDIFRLMEHRDEIVSMEGFGEKSFENLAASIEKASETKPERLLYALGVQHIGVANAKNISRYCNGSFEKIMNLTEEELILIDGIGDIMARSYVEYFNNPQLRRMVEDLLKVVKLDEEQEERGNILEGLTFVITGSLNGYSNRDELKTLIENQGGKVAGSVSSKTDYLINNNTQSTSGKNKKAKELGVDIIDEATVTKWLTEGR